MPFNQEFSAHLDVINNSAKVSFNNSYQDLKINLPYSDEQFTQLHSALIDAGKQWREAQEFEPYYQQALKNFNKNSEDDESNESDEDDEGDENEQKWDETTFLQNVKTDFNNRLFWWTIRIDHPLSSTNAFLNLLKDGIKNKWIRILYIKAILTPEAIDGIIDACMGAVSPHTVTVRFSKEQNLSEAQASKLFENRACFRSLEFSGSAISDNLALQFATLPAELELTVKNNKVYSAYTYKRYLLEYPNLSSLFSSPEISYSTAELKLLTQAITEGKTSHYGVLFISKGDYSDPAWGPLFTTIFTHCKIREFSVSGLDKPTFNLEVLCDLLRALVSHRHIWKIDFSIPLPLEAYPILEEMLSVNSSLKELEFRHTGFNLQSLTHITNGLISNPKSTLKKLSLSYNHLGVESGDELFRLITNCKQLETLQLGSTGIRSQALTRITEALTFNTNLRSVSLFENPFSDEDLLSLAEMIALNTSLTSFHCASRNHYTTNTMTQYLNCLDLNKTLLDHSLGYDTQEECDRASAIVKRNNDFKAFRRFEDLDHYCLSCVVLFQANRQAHSPQAAISHLTSDHILNILAFLVPYPNFDTNQHLELIQANLQNKRWETSIKEKENNHSSWPPRPSTLTLFLPWPGPSPTFKQHEQKMASLEMEEKALLLKRRR